MVQYHRTNNQQYSSLAGDARFHFSADLNGEQIPYKIPLITHYNTPKFDGDSLSNGGDLGT